MSDAYIPAPKPPLSDPMAEARAEDAAAEAARAAAAPTVEADSTVEGTGTADTTETAATDEAGATTEASEAEAVAEAAPKPKGADKVALGLLTKERAKRQSVEAQLAEAQSRNKAMTDLLASQGHAAPDPGTPVPARPAGERTYTQAELNAAASEIAEIRAFNEKADQLFEVGREKFGTWGDALANLNAADILSPSSPVARPLVEAALATGAAPDILNHLGHDLEEAARITALPPVRMGVELARLAAKLTAPKGRQVSAAPAPIGDRTVRGSSEASVDFAKLAEGSDMQAYVAARKKAGDKWAGR